MAQTFQTYIFLDLESTGLAHDCPRITEICLVAVHLHSLQNPERDEAGDLLLPHVVDKVCLCVDPVIPLTSKAAHMTGLSNEKLSLNQKQSFSPELLGLLRDFLERQDQPICLVAHNGFSYDFPLLKTELQRVQGDFSGPLSCLDSCKVLRTIDPIPNSVRIWKGYYTLPEVYRRFFGKEPQRSHCAEGDVLTLLMIFLHKAQDFLRWVNIMSLSWAKIVPMYTP
ncbi:three prime repair exonuclease 2-like [Microcaecilia unicolor]|uniref:exodeoxyribonuclease III n=1 Tax=Microcaecilia unicolor TaxID=1415580 RepID=A0A6P7X4N1_9AMPH|nr:three prime repair exonuclease 2-like [Microcaecilia unicolor]